jgi:hypothetical protein
MVSSLNLDIHKDAISIPGLSLKSLWSSQQPGIEFEFLSATQIFPSPPFLNFHLRLMGLWICKV